MLAALFAALLGSSMFNGGAAYDAFPSVALPYSTAYVSTGGTIASPVQNDWYDIYVSSTLVWAQPHSSRFNSTFNTETGETTPTFSRRGDQHVFAAFAITFSSNAGVDVEATITIDDNEASPTETQQEQCKADITTASNNKPIEVVGFCVVELEDVDGTNNDSLRVQIRNTSGTNNITIIHSQFVLVAFPVGGEDT